MDQKSPLLFFCFLAVLLLLRVAVYGQLGGDLNQNIAPRFSVVQSSPEAMSIARYGSTPVSLYTGIPDITIPLYTIEMSGFSLPISLSYHAGGIRVDELASNTGLGWTLNYGGMHTVQVNGIPDDAAGGWYNSELFPQTGGMRTIWDAWENYEDDPEYEYLRRVAAGELDTEPDLFQINVNGRSFNYFTTQAADVSPGTFHFMPYGRFELNAGVFTDQDDVRYTFDVAEYTNTSYMYLGYAEAGFDMPLSFMSVANYLGSVNTPQGNTLSYTYQDYTYSYDNQESGTRYTRVGAGTPGCGIVVAPPTRTTSSSTTVSGKRIQRILSDTGIQITFFYDHIREDIAAGEARALTGIEVRDLPNDRVIREIALDYGYFISSCSVPTPDCKRLQLLSVQIAGQPAHQFAYHETPLPSRLSFSQDHYGYYNMASNSMLFPQDPSRGFSTGANRTPNQAGLMAGMLTGITYPTGGGTDFIYEMHTDASGLRIKRIDERPLLGQTVSRHYEYSAALLPFSPDYVYDYYQDHIEDGVYFIYDCHFNAQSTSNLQSVLSLGTGGPVYARVTEYTDSKDQGYSDHFFSTGGGMLGYWGYPFGPLIRKSWLNGHPTARIDYAWDPVLLQHQKVYELTHQYNFNTAPDGDVRKRVRGAKIVYRKTPIKPGPGPSVSRGPEFYIQFHHYESTWVHPTGQTEIHYDRADPSRTAQVVQTFAYDNPEHLQLTRHRIADSRGDTLEHLYRYMQDVQSWGHMSAPLVEKRTLLEKSGVQQLIAGELIWYNNWRGTFPQWYRTLALAGPVAPASIPYYTGGVPNPAYVLQSGFQFDASRNLIQVEEKEGATTAYVWGYGGKYPVGRIENATYAEVSAILGTATLAALNAPSVSDATINAAFNTLRNHTNMRKAQVSSFTYRPLVGMTAMTDPRGITEYYVYDGFQRLQDVLDLDFNILRNYQYHYRP